MPFALTLRSRWLFISAPAVFLLAWQLAGAAVNRWELRRLSSIVDQNGDLLPLAFNFGSVPSGRQFTHTFVIVNPFDEPLTVKSVTPACHCTIVDQAPKSIPSRGSGQLTLSLDVGLGGGHIGKQVLVQFVEHKPLELILLADVIEEFPLDVLFGNAKRGEIAVRTAIVRSVDGKVVQFRSLDFDKSLFDVHAVDGVPSSPEGRLVISLSPNIAYGGFAGNLSFTTDQAAASRPVITVHGRIYRPIEVDSNAIALGVVAANQSSKKEVAVYSPYGYPFSIRELSISPGAAQFVKIGTQRQENEKVWIPLTVQGGFNEKILAGTLTINAEVNDKMEQTSVEFYAASAPRF